MPRRPKNPAKQGGLTNSCSEPTIETPAFDPEFLLDLIRDFDLSPTIRFGLAQPVVGGSNSFIYPRQYAAAGARLARFARLAREAGVRLSFDCGFVPCMFPLEDERIVDSIFETEALCSPILDLLPDGQVVPCFPLTSMAIRTLQEHETADAMRGQFADSLALYRRLGIYPGCSWCEWREAGRCAGGCLAATMIRLR